MYVFRQLISQIFQDHNVSDQAQAAIILLQLSQERQHKSVTSNERKEGILDSLFHNRRETLVKINLFRGLLDVFQGFVKQFQSEKPLIHTLHTRMTEVATELLGMFMKPEKIPDSITKLMKLDVTDRTLQKPDRGIGVGKYAYTELNKARIDKSCRHWVQNLYANLRHGYVMAAKKMLKMPIDNKTLRWMTALDPDLGNHSQTSSALKRLASCLPNVFSDEQNGHLAEEIDKYCVDPQVKDVRSEFNEEDRIDTGFWTKVFKIKTFTEVRYPMLKKLVMALLTIFSGPLIESTFNIMDDIIEKDRTQLTVVNYEAVAIVKTSLKRRAEKSTKMRVSRSMIKACINAYASYQDYLKRKREEVEKKRTEKLNSSIQMLKLEKASRIAKLVRLKNRIVNRKRKATSGSSCGHQWKRIKSI
ncbi:uncharacterized protein LOC128243033 isoform X1 [Mya arenaria]|uniref:uncharacterized protein LOC128243033 isoform X1 n=1 Tax=Mya arenaria TaxID=6604 RepID=UPI0022E074B1|nr:uncharacterized protein LOC128243033 isoform X1 [Mya arenaria]